MDTRCGFQILGGIASPRLLVRDAPAAFREWAAGRAPQVGKEGYLSAFDFGPDFAQLLEATASPAGFTGACGGEWLWLDIDRHDGLEHALRDTRTLVAAIRGRYRPLRGDDLLVFFSGGKGFHIGLPTSMWSPPPSLVFHSVAKRLALHLSDVAGVEIDRAIYDRVRAFRAPNSRHPKSGLIKRRLFESDLAKVSVEDIRRLAATTEPFDAPVDVPRCSDAEADWRVSSQECEQVPKVVAKPSGEKRPAFRQTRLLRQTREFMRDGAPEGERAACLFVAACNLFALGCSPAATHEILTQPALDSGLSPKETRSHIDGAIKFIASKREGSAA